MSHDDNMIDGFDASTVEPTKWEALPVDWYKMQITEWENRETRDKQGKYLSLTWEILEGPYKGRMIFQNLNLHNRNQKAVDIARGDLSLICRAVGKMKPKSAEDLCDIPVMVKLGSKKKDDGDLENKIKDILSINDFLTKKAKGELDSRPQGGNAKPAAASGASSPAANGTGARSAPWRS